MRPLWLQLKKEESNSEKKNESATSMAEKKRKIAQEKNLADNYNWCVAIV